MSSAPSRSATGDLAALAVDPQPVTVLLPRMFSSRASDRIETPLTIAAAMRRTSSAPAS
jgi:hypothetical protein